MARGANAPFRPRPLLKETLIVVENFSPSQSFSMKHICTSYVDSWRGCAFTYVSTLVGGGFNAKIFE